MEYELQHHGILGQKWGIRRYQNSDGSLTAAGLKRYSDSKERYEKSKEAYKTVKQLHKSGMVVKDEHGNNTKVAVSKNTVKEAKSMVKQAKGQMNKDYKHLKQDKLADQGKKLYANGKTITGNDATVKALATVGVLSFAAASAGYSEKIISQKVAGYLLAASTASTLAAYGVNAKNQYENKRLRAYYGHSSKY